MIEFFMPMIPPTATGQEKGQNKKTGAWYEPDDLKAARSKLEANLAGHRPSVPYEGPVRLYVKWCFPIKAKHRDGEWKTSRPDTDNLQKVLKDCMTKLDFWGDDAQVCSEVVEKFWARIPGIYVAVELLREG